MTSTGSIASGWFRLYTEALDLVSVGPVQVPPVGTPMGENVGQIRRFARSGWANQAICPTFLGHEKAMLINPAPLAQTVSLLRQRSRDLANYVDEMCDRVDAVDPDVQALLPEPDRRERLRAEAAGLEGRYPQPASRPPLYGALVAVKDIFHVDGFVTRAGSDLPPELFAGAEALCVTTLREAGALILGKSVTTEFAYFCLLYTSRCV